MAEFSGLVIDIHTLFQSWIWQIFKILSITRYFKFKKTTIHHNKIPVQRNSEHSPFCMSQNTFIWYEPESACNNHSWNALFLYLVGKFVVSIRLTEPAKFTVDYVFRHLKEIYVMKSFSPWKTFFVLFTEKNFNFWVP